MPRDRARAAVAALTDAGVAAVVDLCRHALDLPEDAAEASEIVARLRETATPGGAATARRTTGVVAVEAGVPVGVALGSLSHRHPGVGHVDLVAVRPDRRRRGIARTLLRRVERELAAWGATEVELGGNAPYYAWPGVDVRYTPAVCLASVLGYEHHDTAFNMTVDLSSDASPALAPTDAAERRLAEGGVSVRRAAAGDVAALVDLAQRRFGGSWPVEVTDSLNRSGAGCHLATRDGSLLGFAAYGSSRPSWFGPMGTDPAGQGLGIGSVLLRRCLRDMAAAGHRRVQIGWVGPVAFYAGRAGARIERVFFRYRRRVG